jgi:ABC-2 type transport system ATP-binding protein
MLAPNSGSTCLFGMDPIRDRISVMKRTGVLFGNRSELWWDHPVRASFEWKRDVWNIPKADYEARFERQTAEMHLSPFMDAFARELSLGQRMRANLALTLLHAPELVLLDEPTLGLDVLAKRDLIQELKRINRDHGVTLVVTSHDMDDLTAMASRLILLSQGRIAFDGTSAELLRLTGDKRTLCITCDGSAPEIACAVHLRSELNQHFYAFDGSNAPQVLASAGQLPGLRDAEITHAPIEEVIAGLYAAWQGKA